MIATFRSQQGISARIEYHVEEYVPYWGGRTWVVKNPRFCADTDKSVSAVLMTRLRYTSNPFYWLRVSADPISPSGTATSVRVREISASNDWVVQNYPQLAFAVDGIWQDDSWQTGLHNFNFVFM